MLANLTQIFALDVSPWQMILRGTLMYWFIFLLLRIAGRRDISSIGVGDLLVLMLITDSAGNVITGDTDSFTAGAIVVATLVFWAVAIDRIGYFFPPLRHWLTPSRTCLVKNGVIQRRGLRHEYITPEELRAEARLSGFEELEQIKLAFMESNGRISFIERKRS